VLLPDGTFEIAVMPAGETPAPATLDPVCLPGGLGDRKWADRRPLERWQRPRLGLLVDSDGAVLEASTANVFLVEDGAYVTPPADGRILPGVTRARLIAATGAREEEFGLDRLDAADAVLLTSAIALVTPVGEQAEPSARRARSALSASASPRTDRAPSPAHGR
jgi:para-aminobenzoate synthetase/4-amino-4-deoxychorismate lyase